MTIRSNYFPDVLKYQIPICWDFNKTIKKGIKLISKGKTGPLKVGSRKLEKKKINNQHKTDRISMLLLLLLLLFLLFHRNSKMKRTFYKYQAIYIATKKKKKEDFV